MPKTKAQLLAELEKDLGYEEKAGETPAQRLTAIAAFVYNEGNRIDQAKVKLEQLLELAFGRE